MLCNKCRRCNPTDARFCWFDGAPLNGQTLATGPVDVGRLPFISPFLFPSGRACRNFEELALTCQEHWTDATDLLRRGFLEGFLGQIGRADLARAAHEAAGFADVDRGLDYFLAKVPNRVLPEPKLRVEPASINLGTLAVGQDRVFQLRLKNDGKRLLQGSIATLCGWLTIGEGAGAQAKVFQFGSEQSIAVHIKGKVVRGSVKPLEAELLVESNGGQVTIPVTAAVPVKAFAEGVLAGASSPRDLVQKARAAPQAAAPLFENGAVARWYQANGWRYPVRSAPAAGIGAVQQYFEALGLLRPPKVELSEPAVALTAGPGEKAQHMLKLHGADNQIVWCHAAADQPWLEVGRTVPAGRLALVPLLVRSVPNQPGAVLTARLTVTTNGNQQFLVPVQLSVTGAAGAIRRAPSTRPSAPVPVATAVPAASPAMDTLAATPSRTWIYGLAVILLFMSFFGTVVHDLLLKPEEASSFAVAPLIDSKPRIALHFHDQDVKVRLGPSGLKPAEGEVDENHIPAVWLPSMRFGLTMVGQPDPVRQGYDKRLTYEQRGLTNNTCVRLDNHEWLFGDSPFRRDDGKPEASNWTGSGRWLNMKEDLGTDPTTGLKIEGYRSAWIYDEQKVVVTQTVEIVPGDQSRLLDTCLVRYRIDNQDSKKHLVGLRMLLDTFIGSNDGVPFTLPGAPNLCDTEMRFNQPQEVPDFIEALERPDLQNPGTIAHLGLKRQAPFDPPDRLMLGAWPNFRLHDRDARCLQEKTLWEVPLFPIKTLTPADSAVTIYWNEKELQPGQHREMAFTYGLGNVASGEAQGRLGITVGGSFVEGGEFTVTAYVREPSRDETVNLDLPEGFHLLSGTAQQTVPPLPPDASSPNSPVTWKVRGPVKSGQYTLRVRASSGIAQGQPIVIRPKGGIFD